MIPTVTDIMNALPPLKGQRDITVPGVQSVCDIKTGMMQCHKDSAGDYDRLVEIFSGSDTLHKLFDFCKSNLTYKAESESDQTTRTPIAIIALSDSWGVDCKHYSNFIAGVIDACNRSGLTDFDWCYRFASYNLLSSEKEHVFVVVNPGTNNEIWIDPAPIDNANGSFIGRSFNDRKVIPFYITDEKPKTMLSKISGCCRPTNNNYHGMGYISQFQTMKDDQYMLDPGSFVDPGSYISPLPQFPVVGEQLTDIPVFDPGEQYEPPISPYTPEKPYDPQIPTYDPTELNKLEDLNNPPYISYYPTVTGEDVVKLPNPDNMPPNETDKDPEQLNSNSGLNVGFNLNEFIAANPVATIAIGGALVIGAVYLYKRSKKKKRA